MTDERGHDLDRTEVRIGGRAYTGTELIKIAAAVLLAIAGVVLALTVASPWWLLVVAAGGYAGFLLLGAQ